MEKNEQTSAANKSKDVASKAKKYFKKSVAETSEFVRSTTENLVVRTRKISSDGAAKIQRKIVEKRDEKTRIRLNEVEEALEAIKDTEGERVFSAIGQSPLELTSKRVKQIKSAFPIPREQCILWADAEFDLRPSGIAVTDQGVFIKTDAHVFEKSKRRSTKSKQSQQSTCQEIDKKTDQSALFYFRWENFDPAWFISDSRVENKALLIDEDHSTIFINACKSLAEANGSSLELDFLEIPIPQSGFDQGVNKVAPIAAAAVESAQTAVFVEQKALRNTPAGHGEMAEEANTMLDRLHGLDAKVIGRSNTKDGADRQIGNNIFIQSKYFNSARGSLESSFSASTGEYRYYSEGTPMQLEVPKDQYQQVLKGFEKKIEAGKVPGVTDPKEAKNIVREGRLTYRQAVNLTKPGTIESLSYDALTGAIISTSAFGITFVTTAFIAWRRTKDLNQAIQAGTSAGLQVFGLSFLQHLIVSQVARTSLPNTLMGQSQFVVQKLGFETSAWIVNGIRSLSGKSPIHGAAASKHLAKILRSNVVTATLTFAIFSVPQTYNLASKKISKAQYTKNISTLVGSMAGGAGGALAAGLAAGKVAGIAGTKILPGVGTAVGIAGGFVGGFTVAKTVETVGKIFHEDDVVTFGRFFNAITSCMISEYLLDETEIDSLVDKLGQVKTKEFKKLATSFCESDQQEAVLREFLTPFFDTIADERDTFSLPEYDVMVDLIAEQFA